MKFLIAGFLHETNTFSPVETPLSRFCWGRESLPGGEEAIRAYRGSQTCIGGFISIAESIGAEFVLPVAASAPPSGPVSREAFESASQLILEAIEASEFDGLMLALHGAMVVEGFDDGEGELLRRIREVRPDVPIALALDMHANVSARMVEEATVITGYHLYPHLDQAETAERAASVLLSKISGTANPVTAWGSVPMLPHTMKQATDDSPNKEIQARATALEDERIALSASVFTGFNLADVPDAKLSVVVTTDGDLATAQRMVDELLQMAWAAREQFRYEPEPLSASVTRAKHAASSEGPIFLLDHYDNAASGGTMDTTAVLAEIIKQELDDAAFFGIYDPAAVQAAIEAGVGTKVDLSIGGKFNLTSLNAENPPLRLQGTVKTISDGIIRSRTKASFGVTMSMGRAVVVDTGKVEVVLVSKHIEPFSIDILTAVGIDPRRRKFVALKSRQHWRADLGPVAQGIVGCAGLGVCTSDYTQLSYKKLSRPIYPLDPDVAWTGSEA